MAKEQNTPLHVHVELALQALERAMSGIRLIEETIPALLSFAIPFQPS